jgi:mono/diheme cytochrome c family protein
MVFFACKHVIVQPDTGGGSVIINPPPVAAYTCSTDTVYFANSISPLIASGCAKAGCHDAITHKDGVNLTSYTNIMKYVAAGNAASSKLYKVLLQTGSNRMPPPPNAAFTQAQMDAVKKWINQGAKNNACMACDTTDFKYSTAVKNIIANKCQGCHNPNSLGVGIDLSTYAAVKTQAVNGKLYGSVSWAAGFSAMPKSSVKLPECEITQVKKWIDAGSPNN